MGRQLIVVFLLHHFAALAGATATATLAHAHAASNVQSQAGFLRVRSHSSHGLRANVFRAASASRSTAHTRLQSQSLGPPMVPLYTPKMGLANVTEPTPYPPPPPVLHPWRDHQPLDTAVGNYLISGFIAQPTVTPPPSQSSLDLAFACPALLTWPGEIAVSAPDVCGSVESGNWTGKDGTIQLQWSTSCMDLAPGISPPSVTPITTYSMPNGDLFGSSQERTGLGGNYIEIKDCGAAVIFTVEEKIYKQAGEPDEETCKKHKSCDGVIYLQYFMKDASGKLVALSPYTTIFQDAFDITDPAGGLIAKVSRNGWDPDQKQSEGDCAADQKPRLWNLQFASSPPGIWSTATNQWPMATFMTMLAQRDQGREPDGRVLWSTCEVVKSTGLLVVGAVLFACCACIPMVIFLVCSAPILHFLGQVQEKLLPKRMGKPAVYGN